MSSVVGVDHNLSRGGAIFDRHIQGVNYKVCVLIIIDGPTDDLSTKSIKIGGAIELAFPSGVFGNVGSPELVGLGACVLPIDQVGSGGVLFNIFDSFALGNTLQACNTHQLPNGGHIDMHAPTKNEFGSHSSGSVGATVVRMNFSN